MNAAIKWRCHILIREAVGEWTGADFDRGVVPLTLHDEWDGNILVTAGATLLLQFMSGQAGVTASWNAANAYIGVGDGNGSSPQCLASDTDLTATVNKLRIAMDPNYPGAVTANSLTYSATASTSQGNFAWNEFGIFNANVAGTMLNHAPMSKGTKLNTVTRQIQISPSIS